VAKSTDSVLTTAVQPSQYPTGPDGATATELIIDPARFRAVFTADLPQLQSDVYALSQRPIAAAAFEERNGPAAWKNLPAWAAVGTADHAAGSDVVRQMAERAGATVTEIDGSHVIMISQPDAVTTVILDALKAVG
jgi:pimeloyl-ACP methyl ester carboxylesterase